MAYVYELGNGRRVYLDNQGTQTVVTIASANPGQQQQSSSGFQTGVWSAPPEATKSGDGAVIKLTTSQGQHFIQIQGSSVSMTGETSGTGSFQQMQVSSSAASSMPSMQPMTPMQPMEPMKPMQPMKMGDMQMNMNPMEMRMGNMEMRMGEATSTTTASTRRFCSQCGTPVKEGDRFCSSCGHRLN